MALGQHSEHGDHSASPFEPVVCVLVFAFLLAAVRKHAMVLGQHSDHLDHRASLLEPVVCACAQKKRFCATWSAFSVPT